MDPVSALKTAWSVFNTCLEVYRFLNEVIELDASARIWDVKMRIERVRFQAWGKTLGFIDHKAKPQSSPDQYENLDIGGLGDIMQIEEARQIIYNLLKLVSEALDEFQKKVETYNLLPKADQKRADAKKAASRVEKKLFRMLESTKNFAKQVAYVVIDKDAAETQLKKLADLNDSLEKLLSLPQKVQQTKAISSGVLVHYQETDELDAVFSAATAPDKKEDPFPDPGPKPTSVLIATARVKKFCVAMFKPSDTDDPGASDGGGQLIHAVDAAVPKTSLVYLTAPEKTERDMMWPMGRARYGGEDNKVHVIIEWRRPIPTSPGFDISRGEFVQRQNLIVKLLQLINEQADAGDYRVLKCVGYVNSEGRSDGQLMEVVGFISRIPDWADGQRDPVTLNKLLTEAFNDKEPGGIPSLRTRFELARFLTNALYQLLCSHWLHRNLSSHQVIFFYDKANGTLRLNEPYLIGLQYSRPDDNITDGGRRQRSEGMHRNWGDLALYLHPKFSSRKQGRYRRSDDVYSLGILLFEVAFWEPVQTFREDGKDVADAASLVLTTAKTELASEVGELYQDAVLTCLQGLRTQNSSVGDKVPDGDRPESSDVDDHREYDGTYQGEDTEYGIEVDFFWNVLYEIEKCRV